MPSAADIYPDAPPTPWVGRRAPVAAAGLAALALLAIYGPTASSIVAIWWRSETFAHGFVVLPVCVWLAWRRREALARIPARPWWPGLAFVFLAGALWLATSVGDALGLKQFALAFMIQAAIVTVLGWRVARAAAFPLLFLLFAVPAGEFLVPTLVDWTADFTVAALRLSGVPVYRTANHFIIPSGAWSVVEACSGIRYVIASVMVGTIYAAVAYRSTSRRILFVVASIVVPIVANWLRAYMIVMIGHLSDNRYAVGIDHLIYGWVFFGVVMALLFWVGSFWREDDAPAAAASPAAVGNAIEPASALALAIAALAAVLVGGMWQALEAALQPARAQSIPAVATVDGEGGWVPRDGLLATWRPHYKGYAWSTQQTFRKDGRDVALYLAYYRNQDKGRELVTSGNLLVARDDWQWKLMSEGTESVDWAGQRIEAGRADLLGERTQLAALRLYWVDGRVTASEYVAKAWLAWSRLAGRGDDAALVIIYTPFEGGAGTDRIADVALRQFAAAMSPAIERALAATRAQGG